MDASLDNQKTSIDPATKNQLIQQVQHKLLQADFNLSEFMDLIVEQMSVLTPATGVVIELVEGDVMVYRAATGTIKANLGLRLTVDGSISGLCVKENKLLISNDTEIDPRVNLDACRKVKARSLVVAPLSYRNKAIGVLKILSDKPNAFSQENIEILQTMSGFLASALANQIMQEMRNFL